MAVNEGYTETEVGLIPKDWEVKRLGEIGECIIGLTYKPDNVKSDGLLVLRSSNIEESELTFEDAVFVDVAVPERLIAQKDDILICVRNGSRQLIGKCALIDERARGMTFGAFMSVFRSPYSKYVLHQFRSHIIKRQISENIGATINQITNKNLNSFQIPIPTDETEREAIVTALDDIDALISYQSTLISKKQSIKQGALQALVTGRIRLPDFSGEWQVKSIADTCHIVNGGTPTTTTPEYWDGHIKWCTPSDITQTRGKYIFDTARRITEAGLKSSSATILPVGALLLCSRATIGEVKIAATPIATNQGFKSLICKEGASNEFLYYLLLTIKSKLIEKSIGSTFLEISKKDISSIEFALPELPEQEAIASVLSDMDNEIEVLEQQRDKTLSLRQGMMQELLTGKTRLV